MHQKTAIITGVTRGCGRALADRFIENGFTVFGCGRSQSEIDELSKIHPVPHQFHSVDVSKWQDVKNWADTINIAPDFLINNASIINKRAPLWQIDDDEFSQIVDINIKGVANVIRAFVPKMLQRNSGIIVNFSSEWGRSTSPNVAPYCASKFAIEGLTQALAQELPNGMVAVALRPGTVNTDMLQKISPGFADSCQTPEQWSHKAIKKILSIKKSQNGESIAVG